MLVERKDLANAVALNAAAQNACRVTGPALAGVLIAVIGIAGTFAVAALLQILALTATLQLPASTPIGTARGGSVWASLTLGFGSWPGRVPLQLDPVGGRDERPGDAVHLDDAGLCPGRTGHWLDGAGTAAGQHRPGTVAGALAVAASRRLGSWSRAQV